MPLTAVPSEYLSETIRDIKRQLAELSRAVGRPTSQLRDGSDNVVHMADGGTGPIVAARNQGVSLVMAAGQVTVADEQGRGSAPLAASGFTGPVTGDTHGVHHGDVGVASTEFYNHYGDLHGNSYGFHYGAVGDGTTQNQINATQIYGVDVHVTGRFYGEVGVPGTGPFFTTYGDVGNGTNFFNLFGTVHAPSERGLKTAVQDFDGAAIVDAVESPSWRWDPLVRHDDGQRHAGPMVDDIADAAPWLVRAPSDPEAARMLSDRDLIGVLWNALRDTRARMMALELRVAELESKQGEVTE